MTTTQAKCYGILIREPGKITMFIDDPQLRRFSFVVDVPALDVFLETSAKLMPREVDEVMSDLSQDLYNDHVWLFISLSKHEWTELDESNEPLIKQQNLN
jgi:hypothetical protein